MYSRSKKVQKEYNEVKKTLKKDECFICEKELLVLKTEYWVLLKNRFPYKQSKEHYLLSPKRHVQKYYQLTLKEKEELESLVKDTKLLYYGIEFDEAFKNKTTESSFKYHLHIQVIYLKWWIRVWWFLKRML